MTADAWFYTREGERFGPVTFTDLQAAAGSGQLNPRLDMAWLLAAMVVFCFSLLLNRLANDAYRDWFGVTPE